RHTRSDRDWSSDVCSSDLVFDRPIFPPRQLADVCAIDDEPAVQRVSNFDAKRLVAVSLLAQLMIEVRQADQATLAGPIELIEKRSEERRVGKEGRGGW